MRDVKSFPLSLKESAKDVGALEILVCDPHPSQKQHEVREFCHEIGLLSAFWRPILSGLIMQSCTLAC
ncbi:hypothetical protein ACHAXH_002638 [Discostella pseudostelligera]